MSTGTTRITSGAGRVAVGPAVGLGVADGAGVLVTPAADGTPLVQEVNRISTNKKAKRARTGFSPQTGYQVFYLKRAKTPGLASLRNSVRLTL